MEWRDTWINVRHLFDAKEQNPYINREKLNLWNIHILPLKKYKKIKNCVKQTKRRVSWWPISYSVCVQVYWNFGVIFGEKLNWILVDFSTNKWQF